MAHLGQACSRNAAHIAHSENGDIHISDAPIALRFVNREIVHGTSAKLCHLSRSLFQKAPLYRRFTHSKKRLVTVNWIFPLCSPPRHQSTNNQYERSPTPIPPLWTVQSSFLHQTPIVSIPKRRKRVEFYAWFWDRATLSSNEQRLV